MLYLMEHSNILGTDFYSYMLMSMYFKVNVIKVLVALMVRCPITFVYDSLQPLNKMRGFYVIVWLVCLQKVRGHRTVIG